MSIHACVQPRRTTVASYALLSETSDDMSLSKACKRHLQNITIVKLLRLLLLYPTIAILHHLRHPHIFCSLRNLKRNILFFIETEANNKLTPAKKHVSPADDFVSGTSVHTDLIPSGAYLAKFIISFSFMLRKYHARSYVGLSRLSGSALRIFAASAEWAASLLRPHILKLVSQAPPAPPLFRDLPWNKEPWPATLTYYGERQRAKSLKRWYANWLSFFAVPHEGRLDVPHHLSTLPESNSALWTPLIVQTLISHLLLHAGDGASIFTGPSRSSTLHRLATYCGDLMERTQTSNEMDKTMHLDPLVLQSLNVTTNDVAEFLKTLLMIFPGGVFGSTRGYMHLTQLVRGRAGEKELAMGIATLGGGRERIFVSLLTMLRTVMEQSTTADVVDTRHKLGEVFGTVLLGDIIEDLVIAYWQKMSHMENGGSRLRDVVYIEAQNTIETLLDKWVEIAKCLRELY
ncbi:hypothetical protein POJ06DRAFT_250434 [Lipomyces tetrasporus]|uniref:Uncharacterized protein n=1 Tax=Lipomyces tetrasporus TaxID=54092 RepID=A0AAD7VTU6_9ASCO|nr:uncharacterized protein POJ06DRAFT_250434 [Lipomyces tetrasporus]KAJ8101094.1 hypothetical protein POJ06DRAFT_250434 [Lipomyces tetrasporus]